MNLLDVQLLAGSGLVAAKYLGFNLLSRKSYGFGDNVVEANDNILGKVTIDLKTPHFGPDKWKPEKRVDVLAGCPPCAGFSILNFRGRGVNSPHHKYTWDLINYAAKCNMGKGPTTVVWECVQPAFKEGRALMQQYFNELCTLTKSKYKLTHVLMSGASVGSASERKRYFWVASKLPFGVNLPPERVGKPPVTVGDRLGEILEQPELREGWPHHTVLDASAKGSEILKMVLQTHSLVGGRPGYTLQQAAMELRDAGKLPQALRSRYFDSHDCWIGFPGPKVLDPAKPCPVITGGSAADFLHPWAPRFLTVYEFSRLMGYPAQWSWPGSSVRKAVELIGKGVPVESWAWILKNIKSSLEGNPGDLQGGTLDVTYAWQGEHKIKVG
jgi:site-specific DNA-cytosine methylase